MNSLPESQSPSTKPALPFSLCVLAVAIALLASLVPAHAANWPHWRGPRDIGSTDSGHYVSAWTDSSNMLWKITLPGKGCSTPIVWEDRIFVTAPVNGQDSLLAYDWSGKLLWQSTMGAERPGKHRNGSGCNPSPATDGKNVYVYFKSGDFACIGFDGKQLWKMNLVERYGKDTLYWDYGTSPVLSEKLVIMAMMYHGASYLAGFEKETGALAWKVPRVYETPVEGDHSYATPIVTREDGREILLVWGGQHLTAHDPATGKEIWSCGDFNPQSKNNWVAVASPVLAGGMVVVPYGRGERLHGIKLGGKGDVTKSNRVWLRNDTGSFVPTPLEYDGHVYILRDRGEVECIDPASGKTIWNNALPKNSLSYFSSPVAADGKIYAAREDGVVFVARIKGEFAVLSENNMGERIIASPVPVNNRLLIRGEEHLFCIGEK